MWKKHLEELGVVENCVEKGVGKIRLKNLVDKFGMKVVFKNVWNN